MNSCTIDQALIRRIRIDRNSFTHNASRTATSDNLRSAFHTFKDLLEDPDVTQYIDTRDSLADLADIEHGVAADTRLLNIEKHLQKIFAEVNAQRMNIERIEHINQNNSVIFILKHLLGWIVNFLVNKFRIPWYLVVLMIFLVVIPIIKRQDLPDVCLSEHYHFPVHQDLPLLPYLSDHTSLVGRKWLFEDLHSSLISNYNDTNTNGVILVAEMGYGKSAIVSELICPKSKQDIVKDIRKHVVGFHICKFDVKATHSVGRFILRVAGFLAMKSDEFGNIISMLSEHSLLHNKDSCEKEPIACFDQAILHPIKQLNDIQDKPWIFIIDALDECGVSVKVEILNLMTRRIKILPLWFKIIITSRNETYLSYFRRIEIRYLETDDVRNKNDLETFIDMKLPVSSTKSRVMKDLIKASDGNFDYGVHAVKWLLTLENTNGIPELPSDIAHIYEINFDRQFDTTEAYAIPKMILEIICSTINPVGKEDIYNIVTGNNAAINQSEFNNYFQTLSFVLNTDLGVHVKHQTLFVWLISETNNNYRISLESGHALISKYLFSKIKLNKRMDVVSLAIHVGNSNDKRLQEIFVSSKMINVENIFWTRILHKLILQTRSVIPLKLILSHMDYVDELNEGRVTAAFVAAAKGNLEQLELLQRKGANVNFQSASDFVITAENISDTLDRIKNVHYSGYSLIHIAAQHGHLNVVDYLLRYNQSLLHIKNNLGMHAGHIACERGHLDVVKTMYKINSSTFDFVCLYYSSRNDHIDIVEWLESVGVKYQCISDSVSAGAIRELMALPRHGLKLLYGDYTSAKTNGIIKPLDIWWLVFKTDPLLAAIQSGSNGTTVFISKIYPESLNCIDAFGFTPALASVVYNRTELFSVFLGRILNDTCHKTSSRISKMNLPEIQHMVSTKECPEDGGLAHLLAIYPLPDPLSFFVENHINSVHWNKQDKRKYYPLDYAIIKNNNYFIRFSNTLKGTDHLRTLIRLMFESWVSASVVFVIWLICCR